MNGLEMLHKLEVENNKDVNEVLINLSSNVNQMEKSIRMNRKENELNPREIKDENFE
jgi:hypothetical protein